MTCNKLLAVKMKKALILVLTVAMCLSMTVVPTFAADDITVQLDGVTLEFDQPPIIENDRTLVPMRAIFEAMGATVTWSENTQAIMGVKGAIDIVMHIGDNLVWKNTYNKITLDVPPKIVNNRTLVPVRAIAESFNATVDWDSVLRRVAIISGPPEDIDIPPQYNDAARAYIVAYRIAYTRGYRQGKSDSEINADFAPLPQPQGGRTFVDEAHDTAYKRGWEDGYAGKKEALTLLDLSFSGW
jgi:hypothetical protein